MTVLLTHERFLPDWGGGGEYIVFETARSLQKQGVDVRVLAAGDESLTEYQGVPTERLPISRYRMNLAVQAIARAARDVDLIQTFNYHACLPSLLAGRWTGKPVVCTMLGLFQDAWIEMRGRLSGRILMAWEALLLRRRFARTIFLSQYSLSQGTALGARPERSLVNNPGIDLAAFRPGAKDNSVLFAGKLEARKGVWDVVEVARLLPEIQFRIAGWGPEEAALRAAAPANVSILGLVQGEALHCLFARSSIFLFPSRGETFGLAVAEAMASGCVVISSVPLDFEGVRIQPGDIPGMRAAIESVLSDPGAADMGRTNSDRAMAYTWERYTSTLLETYREVLGEV
jgi:glycosyltransferase involved in cell wall biosynthesis